MGRPRQWTDDQLRAAVAASTTWGEVVVNMGQADYGAARRNFQAHAVRLELSVEHLPPFKPVAPRQPTDRSLADPELLAAAIAESTSWAGVLRRLGRGVSGSAQARLHMQADELGLDVSHFRGQAWGATPVRAVETPFSRPRDARNLRQAATALATAWFVERSYRVSIPTEPAPYDLVVESDEGFVRVQVKSTARKDRNGRWLVGINRQAYDRSVALTANGARSRRAYTSDEVDVFFIVTSSADQYLIPLPVTSGVESLTLDSKYAAFKVA